MRDKIAKLLCEYDGNDWNYLTRDEYGGVTQAFYRKIADHVLSLIHNERKDENQRH